MRRRILILSVGMTTLVVLAFAIPLTILIRNSAASASLDLARYRAQSVGYYVGDKNHTAADITAYLKQISTEGPGLVSVRLPSGATLGVPPPGGVGTPSQVPGYHGGGDGGDENRQGPPKISNATDRRVGDGIATDLNVDTHNGPAAVSLYLTGDQLYAGVAARLGILGAGSLLVLLLSIAGAELVSRRLARPLEETARTAERLAKGDVDARAPTTGPAEVAQVGAALNGLADRIDEVIAVEREAVADLSHRLRTPLPVWSGP
jgi:signal transduction histidine kinase